MYAAFGDLVAPPPWIAVRELLRIFFSPPTGTKLSTAGGVRVTGLLIVNNGEAVAFIGKKKAAVALTTSVIS